MATAAAGATQESGQQGIEAEDKALSLNPNYVDEIRGMCTAMGLTADFFEASGAPVPAP